MMCPKCQRYNPDTNEECEYCGMPLTKEEGKENIGTSRHLNYSGERRYDNNHNNHNNYGNHRSQNERENQGPSKKDIGVLMCLFLGLLGLIIGLLLYPANSYERDTFLEGWKKCFVVTLLLSIILVVVIVVATIGCAGCASCVTSLY